MNLAVKSDALAQPSAKQRTVVVAGMMRSGSTWLYNAARLIFTRSAKGAYGCWVDDFDAAAAEAAAAVVIKAHSAEEDWAARADAILTCHRDLRDVAVSVHDMGWVTGREGILGFVETARLCHEFWSKRAVLDLPYETIRNEPLKALARVAQALKCDLPAERLQDILTEIEGLTPEPSDKGYDPVNLLHHGDRGAAAPGRWRESLDRELAKAIESAHADWLRRHGYVESPAPIPARAFGPGITVLGTPGYVAARRTDPAAELLRFVGNNTGNLVFQHAVNLLLAEEKKYVGAAGLPYSERGVLTASSHLFFPAANHLRAGADLALLSGYLKRSPVPLVLLGLGAQAPHTDADTDAVAAIAADPEVQSFADALKSRAAFVSVRGAFSLKVCKALGLENAVVLGCPSLLLNLAPDLGGRIAGRLKAARDKAAEGAVKLTISAAAPFEVDGNAEKRAVEQRLFGWARQYHGLYIQQSGGEDAVEIARQNYGQVRLGAVLSMRRILAPDLTLDDFIAFSGARQCIFWDAAQWAKRVASFDLVLGTRMHGNMIGLAAGVPCVHVAHDSRTAELIETMMLPTVTMSEVLEADGLADLLDRARFDAEAFDRNRARIAARFVEAMDGLGIRVAEELRAFAGR